MACQACSSSPRPWLTPPHNDRGPYADVGTGLSSIEYLVAIGDPAVPVVGTPGYHAGALVDDRQESGQAVGMASAFGTGIIFIRLGLANGTVLHRPRLAALAR